MNEWVRLILIVIGVVTVGKIISMLVKKDVPARASTATQTQTTSSAASRNRTETDVMIYYANDRHGRPDKEYRFQYKWVYDTVLNAYTWRAYIIRMPDLCGRDPDLHKTHRWRNGAGQYWVCWDSVLPTLKDIQSVSRVWADAIQEYIATGKRFG